MSDVVIRPVKIIGKCPASMDKNCELIIEGMNLLNTYNSPLCFDFLTQISSMIWPVKSGKMSFFHASCPGCIKDLNNENRVIALIANKERQELGIVFTEYWHLRNCIGETESAKQLRLEAEIFDKKEKDYNKALCKIKEALEELKRAIQE